MKKQIIKLEEKFRPELLQKVNIFIQTDEDRNLYKKSDEDIILTRNKINQRYDGNDTVNVFVGYEIN